MDQEPHFLLSKPLDNIFAGIHESNRIIGHTNERLDSQRVPSGVAMLSLRVQNGLLCDEDATEKFENELNNGVATNFIMEKLDKTLDLRKMVFKRYFEFGSLIMRKKA
ncbi:hypothetical protein PIB30_038182 [Stylosanthes scabra]|uniref:Uncharacterized protein n=1 Tax=Stylosanthes scabra TaxID=79078 RepID=A0ABU6ZCH8_9FABA|nr:hypothetical protein [Stylosanthes scabra]